MNMDQLLADILKLPANWHGAGSFKPGVLKAIARYGQEMKPAVTMETAAGESLTWRASRDAET